MVLQFYSYGLQTLVALKKPVVDWLAGLNFVFKLAFVKFNLLKK